MESDFEEIYKSYYHDIYLFCLSLCRNEAAAEEIAQETFFKALKSFDQFRGSCTVKVWLCQIAKNTYFSYLHKANRYSDADIEMVLDETDYADKIVVKEYTYQIHKILHRMEEPYKEVFTLRVFSELSFKEVGQLFGKTENWARVTFYRAKLKIQNSIKEESL